METVRGLERGLTVLKALDAVPGMALRDLHRQTGLPKPTLLRILSTLESHGYVRRRMADGSWRRTARMAESTKSILHNLLMDAGGEVLDELCREISWPSDLAVYDRGEMHILDTSRRMTPFVINMTGVGYRVPMLQTGLGRAWLAFCPDAEREAILAELAKSKRPFDRLVHEPGYVQAVIEETRAKGYGLRAAGFTLRAKGEEKTDGIGVPVLMGGRVIACISFVWTLPALNEKKVTKVYLKRLLEAASRIGAEVEQQMNARGLYPRGPESSR